MHSSRIRRWAGSSSTINTRFAIINSKGTQHDRSRHTGAQSAPIRFRHKSTAPVNKRLLLEPCWGLLVNRGGEAKPRRHLLDRAAAGPPISPNAKLIQNSGSPRMTSEQPRPIASPKLAAQAGAVSARTPVDLGAMPEWKLADLYPAPDAPEVERDFAAAAA